MSHPPRRPPTIADVAREAGVSVPTVSRVLTGSVPVSQARRDQVQAAIERLGYRPNGAARALQSGRRSMVAVLSGNTARYGFASTLRGIEEAARAAGYLVVITVVESAEPAVVDTAVDLVLGQQVAGAVVLEFDEPGIATTAALPGSLPVVTASAVQQGQGVRPRVDLDDRVAAIEAVDHLLGLGHRTVHHVGIPATGVPVGRTVGWREALEQAGAPVPDPVGAGWDPQAGYRAGQELARREGVTAVLAGNDELAVGVMRAFTEAGRTVPDDVSVVGFDDEPFAAMWSPALTTVRQDFAGLGRRAFSALQGAIEGREVPSLSTAVPRLVVRESTAAPRG